MADTEKPGPEQSKTTASASPPPAVDAIVAAAPAPSAPAPSKGGDEGEQTTTEVQARPEREPKPGDYFRVFTYAKPFDVACFVAAALASGCAGVVSGPAPASCSRGALREYYQRLLLTSPSR